MSFLSMTEQASETYLAHHSLGFVLIVCTEKEGIFLAQHGILPINYGELFLEDVILSVVE